MRGNDILYGEGQDDDIIGGWGHDWISGGTGDDGVLGDDGRIYTSRNGTAEDIYGISVNSETYIEGTKTMTATVYKTGELNKTANLYPFNVDDMKDPFYDPQYADDIIYGGLGNDFLHGGSGDDAISGAEALELFYDAPVNTGNVLGYDATTTLFAAFNPKAPMARVMVDENGKFVLRGGVEFLMNFDASEPDGNDMIFGDLGNDWLVGGPGMDWMFGGLGDDLLNADDDHNPLTDNTEVDFAPEDDPTYYDDILFGGGGRDILIASSTGDVMVDWTGEYNSYVVPTSNFGPGTVIRYSTKDIVKFLYDLSEGAGADTDAGTYITGTDPARNSEPYGEIGLVIVGDPFDKDLVGAPRDPQPGNKGGKK
jgi:Ca2+-binding RTX toxin-like protein